MHTVGVLWGVHTFLKLSACAAEEESAQVMFAPVWCSRAARHVWPLARHKARVGLTIDGVV